MLYVLIALFLDPLYKRVYVILKNVSKRESTILIYTKITFHNVPTELQTNCAQTLHIRQKIKKYYISL